MGKGDKKTKKGKRFAGSYGRVRPRKKSKNETMISRPAINNENKQEVKAKKEVSKKKPVKKKTTKKKSKIEKTK